MRQPDGWLKDVPLKVMLELLQKDLVNSEDLLLIFKEDQLRASVLFLTQEGLIESILENDYSGLQINYCLTGKGVEEIETLAKLRRISILQRSKKKDMVNAN